MPLMVLPLLLQVWTTTSMLTRAMETTLISWWAAGPALVVCALLGRTPCAVCQACVRASNGRLMHPACWLHAVFMRTCVCLLAGLQQQRRAVVRAYLTPSPPCLPPCARCSKLCQVACPCARPPTAPSSAHACRNVLSRQSTHVQTVSCQHTHAEPPSRSALPCSAPDFICRCPPLSPPCPSDVRWLVCAALCLKKHALLARMGGI